MKQKVALISLIFFICFLMQGIAQRTAKVIKVKDADTYVFEVGARILTVRLNKIDAPELKQKSGFEAYQFVSSLIIGKTVTYDSTGKDKYGRVLAGAKLNGMRLDSIIISNGWAWHYIAYDKEELLDELMQEAIRNKLGLWKCGMKNVCPPWLWRGYNEKSRARYCKGCKVFINP